MAKNWSDSEVEAIVGDYFDMLASEVVGRTYNKSEHRRAMIDRLDGRSEGSIERKHQNISAVLIGMGIPCIDGYKPLRNYQSVLPQAVADYLARHPEFEVLLSTVDETPIAVPSVPDILAVLEDAPEPLGPLSPPGAVAETPPVWMPTPTNYLAREAQLQDLGKAGERFVMNFERARLIHFGRDNLADRIEHVAETEGPVAGYDIRSFEPDGSDLFIEAKTTKYGKYTPFFVTRNEMGFSERHRRQYALYRVFKFRAAPRLFTLRGYLEDHCLVTPTQYIARVG